MIYIFNQAGTYGFASEDMANIKAEILSSKCADTDREFFLVEVTKTDYNPKVPLEAVGTVLKAGVYTSKEDALDELVRLKRFLEASNGTLGSFQFKPSEVNAVDLVNLTTPFI